MAGHQSRWEGEHTEHVSSFSRSRPGFGESIHDTYDRVMPILWEQEFATASGAKAGEDRRVMDAWMDGGGVGLGKPMSSFCQWVAGWIFGAAWAPRRYEIGRATKK